MNQGLDISVVIPVYKNADTVSTLHALLVEVLEALGLKYELVFVDDACPQDSLSVLRNLAEQDSRVVVLAMEHNIGQQRAVLAGMDVSDGRLVAVMDADLQDPPEMLPVLLKKISDGGYDVVFAGRRGKYEAGHRLLTSRFYKWTLHLLTGVPIDAGLFLVARRDAVQEVLHMNGRRAHLVAMFGALGVRSVSVPVERAQRPSGVSAYTSWMRLRVGLMAAIWAASWRFGFHPRRRKQATDFPVRERIGKKFQ